MPGSGTRPGYLLGDSLMVGGGRCQVADQCQQGPLVALYEVAERLDVCRQHPPDRIKVIVHGALPCGTELPLRVIQTGPGKVPVHRPAGEPACFKRGSGANVPSDEGGPLSS